MEIYNLFALQFIREYTGKVDELIKDKIEAVKEAKAKENEEQDIVKQQVHTFQKNSIYYHLYLTITVSQSFWSTV